MTKLKDMSRGDVIGSMKSDTTEQFYLIREHGGTLLCECMGFNTSKRRPKTCKHIRRFKLKKMLEGLVKKVSATKEWDSHDDLEIKLTLPKIEDLFKKEVK